MNFLTLLFHGPSIYKSVKTIIDIGTACVTEKRAPSKDDDMKIISAFEDLLEAGLVQLSPEIEANIKKALQELKDVL